MGSRHRRCPSADVKVADLKEADLRGAKLGDADLRWSDMRATLGWTEEQFRATLSLYGAIMPDVQALRRRRDAQRTDFRGLAQGAKR